MIHAHKNYNEAQAPYYSHIFETTWFSIRQGQGCLQICASNDFVQMQQSQHSSRIIHQKSSSQTLLPKTRNVKMQLWRWDPTAKGTDKKIFPQIFQMINESLVLIFSTTFLNYFNLQVIIVQLSCLVMLYQTHSNDFSRSTFISGYNYWQISSTKKCKSMSFCQPVCVLSVRKYGRMPDDTCINMLCF